MGGRTAVGVALALWLGLLAGRWPGCVVIALLAVVPCAALALRLGGRAGGAALLAAVALAGTLRGAGHRVVLDRARSVLDEDALVRVEAFVCEPPLRESGEPVAVVRVESEDSPVPRGARLRLRLPDLPALEWGDRARLLARLDLPRPAANPGGRDLREAADARALVASGRAFAAEVAPAAGIASVPRATAARWRRALERRVAGRLSPEARELVAPLLTGDRTAVPPELGSRLRASGLVHLLALSGLHVGWLAAIGRGACAALGGGWRARALAGPGCALIFVAVAGPLPSLLRAVATEVVGGVARLMERAVDPLQSLALAAIALLAAAPGWAADAGFQLSCAATLGLVSLGPRLAAGLPGPRALHALWAGTAGAQLVSLPILAARFHAVPWAGLLTNLVGVPLAGLLLAAAWLGVAADALAPGAGAGFFSAGEALARALRTIAETASDVPGALVPIRDGRAAPWLAAVGAAALIAALERPRTVDGAARPLSRARVAAAGSGAVALIVALALVAGAAPLRPAPGTWWVVTLDVGQGDAIALGFPDGWWLVDAGPRTPRYDAGESAVLPFLRWAGVREIGTLAITHDDGDHAGGVPAVSRGVRVRRIVVPPALPSVAGPGRRFVARPAARGDTLRRNPAVVVRWPPAAADPEAVGLRLDNEASLVLEVGGGRGRALLAADVDSLVEMRLAPGPAALLKVAHHGAASSSGARALAAIGPGHAVISCGRRSPFGHPAPGTLVRLARAGAIVHRTDRSGAVWFECSARGVRRLDWRRDRAWRRAPRPPDPTLRPDPPRR